VTGKQGANMHLMDREGKVFGKVNVFDLVVVAILALCVISLAADHLVPLRRRMAVVRMPVKKEFEVEMILDSQKKWMTSLIKIGDGQRDLQNDYKAKITNIEMVKDPFEQEEAVVTLWLRGHLDEAGFRLYGKYVLRPGADFALETNQYVLTGTVYSVQEL
jgi:hypothetical protein